MTTRILIVDDSRQWRVFVGLLLRSNPSFQVIGEARDGVEAIEEVATLLPDVVLLDIGMPLLNGIEAAKAIRAVRPESKIIFVSQEDDDDIRNGAFETGAVAYILKSRVQGELFLAIERAMLHPTTRHSPSREPVIPFRAQ